MCNSYIGGNVATFYVFLCETFVNILECRAISLQQIRCLADSHSIVLVTVKKSVTFING